MAIYQGNTKISGNAMMVALPMFFATYQPRKLNNPSWLRADPYSWHSADLYVSAYAHLADNISGITAQTETIAGTTITFYRLSDEIKVVLPDQQTNLDTIYNATGIGYYFVLDTTNRQFKLPRNIYGFTGYRGDVGGYVAPGLPNITGSLASNAGRAEFIMPGGAINSVTQGTSYYSNDQTENGGVSFTFNASASNSIYGASSTVQPPATQAYLYFYVGNTVQNETSVDVAEMTEAINDKVDLSSSWGTPSTNTTSITVGADGATYTAPADGYFNFRGLGLTDGGWAYIGDNSSYQNCGFQGYVAADQWIVLTLPVRKSEVVVIGHGGLQNLALNFIYAQKTN